MIGKLTTLEFSYLINEVKNIDFEPEFHPNFTEWDEEMQAEYETTQYYPLEDSDKKFWATIEVTHSRRNETYICFEDLTVQINHDDYKYAFFLKGDQLKEIIQIVENN